jgi:2-keto-4-pentenoate hydratase/2-oxohepta-3-ene-1,7-dioic acid hydratase in catechol pathway
LLLTTRVNGEVRQQASTGDMLFGVAETIAWLSRFVTLEPGDLIATGTPSGVGSTTGRFLQAGDTVEVEISQLGTLRNPVA